MNQQQRIELEFAKLELQQGIMGLRQHNASVRRERDAVPAHLIVTLTQGLARVETLLRAPVTPEKPSYKRM